MASNTLNSEQLIEETLRLTDEGVYDSIRQASRVTGAPRSTVGHRRAGRLPRSQITPRNARLTPRQEAIFTGWITDLQLQYKPVNYTQLAKIAENLARENYPSRPLGKNWVSRFIKRSPALSHGRSQPFPINRIQSIIPNQVKGWFRHFQEVIQRYNIKPGNIWNMDEIGCQMGHSQKENVVFNRTMGPPKAVTTGMTAWVSILECISMDGRALTPLVIHRGTLAHAPLDTWFPPSDECPHWFYGFTKKGWTDNDYALAWLTEVFLPLTHRDDEWRLLLVDGHGSHSTGEFQWECLRNQVALVYLLPHSTHLTQPADLGPFAQLKNHYSKNLKDYITQGKSGLNRA
jgi:DDE superfamily endonuclease/Tc5 transposase DNA-binding domain